MPGKLRLGALALLLAVAACGPAPVNGALLTAKVRIGVENHTKVTVHDVVLSIEIAGHQQLRKVSFGTLPPGGVSPLVGADGAVNCWNIEATIDGKKVGDMPIDACVMAPHLLRPGEYDWVYVDTAYGITTELQQSPLPDS